jgi:GDP-D-mannose dehydratase
MSLINDIKDYVDNIVVYSTSELWNNYDGKVSVNDKYDYNYSPYIKSKQVLCDTINENRDKYPNVNIIYPFNFNSPYRKEGFLFSKLFDSIMNKKQNTIGDINFNRDLIHPKIIVEQSINTTEDKLVGGGSLINVKDLVKDLFIKSEMKYEDYIVENITNNLPNKRKEYYSSIMYSNYDELLNLTIKDIYEYKIS